MENLNNKKGKRNNNINCILLIESIFVCHSSIMGFTREFRAIRARHVSLTSYDISKAYNFCVVHLIGMITYAYTVRHYNLGHKDLRNLLSP